MRYPLTGVGVASENTIPMTFSHNKVVSFVFFFVQKTELYGYNMHSNILFLLLKKRLNLASLLQIPPSQLEPN
jgi:hypothetical protein